LASITIRQVLQHRSGLPVTRSMVRDALTMTDWHLCVRNLEQATPAYPPGLVPAYHVISDGFMLGELVQRVAGTTVRDFLHSALLAPLGMRDTFLGLPAFGQNGLTRGAPGQAPASCPGAARTTATAPTAGAAAISPAPRSLRQPVPTGCRTSYWHRSRDFLASPALRTA